MAEFYLNELRLTVGNERSGYRQQIAISLDEFAGTNEPCCQIIVRHDNGGEAGMVDDVEFSYLDLQQIKMLHAFLGTVLNR